MKLFYTLLLVFTSVLATAQSVQYNKTNFKAQKLGSVNLKAQPLAHDWNVKVQNLEMPHPGGESYRSFLQEQKLIQRERFPLKTKAGNLQKSGGTSIPLPQTGSMLVGNDYNFSVPNDNSMAISNDGILISTINSTIWMYDMNTEEVIYSSTFTQFGSSLQLGIPSKFDPKVIYDAVSDRFIFVFLRGSSPTLSFTVLAFSEPGNPTGTWNLYKIPGNPLDNNRWSDYPAISQNAEDFFLTINLIIPDEPWQTGFDGTLIWQIPKNQGYDGVEEIDMLMWSDITYEGNYIRNINPVDGEKCFEIDNMYLLSNRNFALSNDTIFLIEITNTFASGEAELNVTALKSSDNYYLSPEARQAEGHTFDTNDSRVLGAVLFENSIQFVHNSLDSISGVCGVYHGFINDLSGTPVVSGNIISYPADDLDLGYPNISHIGNYGMDENTLISFSHSGPNHFAGTSCVLYDSNANDYSARLELKAGDNYIDALTGIYERWGDYTGSQSVYSLPGTVWISGSFGQTNKRAGTWLAEVSNLGNFVGIENQAATTKAVSFPNPFKEMISIDFEIAENGIASIALYDLNGRVIAQLFNDNLKKGMNRLSFDLTSLSSGTYLIQVSRKDALLFTEKVIKQ
jgi:hypothetical protein